MKHRTLILFFCAQLVLIFLHIHKHIFFIKTSFDKQKQERLRDQLLQQKEFALQQLQAVQNKNSIKTYALSELTFQPVRMNQIKHLHYHEPTV